MMSNLEKIKYELKNRDVINQTGNNCYEILQYKRILDFETFDYIITCCDINNFPVSMLSLFSMFDCDGNPTTIDNILFKNYSKIIIGNCRLLYLTKIIQQYNKQQLFKLYKIYVEVWSQTHKILKILNLIPSYSTTINSCLDNYRIYNHIYTYKLNKYFKFDLVDQQLILNNKLVENWFTN